MSLCFRLQVHQAGGRFVVASCHLPETDEPEGLLCTTISCKGFARGQSSFRIIHWQATFAGLHNSINMKVIVTAIRSTRDYPIHPIHSFNRKMIVRYVIPRFCCFVWHGLPFPFMTSVSECEYLMWYIISTHKNHIPLLYALCLFCEFDYEIFCAFE